MKHMKLVSHAAFAFTLAILGCVFFTNANCQSKRDDSLIVIPASQFLDEIPKGNIITDANTMKVNWLFNNTGIVLKSETNLMIQVLIPAAGRYHLYVRSSGEKGTGFKVAINDKVTDSTFGRQALTFVNGGYFDLEKGVAQLKITRIDAGATFDVLALTRSKQLDENNIINHQLHPDVTLLKTYKIPASGCVKFGDVDGDHQTDFMVLEADFTAHIFNNYGKELWVYNAPPAYTKERSEFEAPGVLWDFDQDGKAEVVHWRMIDDKEYLVMADGQLGTIKYKTLWPTSGLPHVYNNFRLAIAKLIGKHPHNLVVFTDYGGTININAYDASLSPLWQHTERRKKDNLGHYIYPIDLDNDGIDEVLVGSLLLNAAGKEIWNRFDLLPDNHDHADSYKFGDVNGDGRKDIITANSETGIFIYEGMTGKIIWQNVAEHTQQIQVGNFLKNVPNPQVVAGGRTYGNRTIGEPYLSSQLYWFNHKGNSLFKWPGNPINGNPDFVKCNWTGSGKPQLFWYKFFINQQGKGQLYFPDGVYHAFDFMGKGAEEVITLSRGYLRVYGHTKAVYSNKDLKQNSMYLKNTVVNHTHY